MTFLIVPMLHWIGNFFNALSVNCLKIVSHKKKILYLESKPHQPWLVFMRVLYPGRIGFWSVRFSVRREENRRTRRKTLGARTRTNNKFKCFVSLQLGKFLLNAFLNRSNKMLP